ncbi:ADOP family duplicated permease [Dyella sp. C9]|uniref:ADOP family duplicated permease n=1 Tax=Dyella sp. C9 TaxID=2202154 RepID=UPI000DEF7B34|nr:ADOP family duplicated permease [Dyella sp. C9]
MNVWLAEIWRAWRASLRRPGFLLLATGVLALGIGASVAVFALIDNTLLKPLPAPKPQQLVVLGRIWNGEVGGISPHEFQYLRGLDGVSSQGLERAGSVVNIAGGGTPEQLPAIYIDRQLLPTLGLQPVLGRNFNEQEDHPGGPKAVLLGHDLWQRRYGGDAGVIGRSMQVEGSTYAIVGVLPASFNGVVGAGDVVLPLALPEVSRDYSHNGHMAIARLADGASLGAVAAQVDGRERAMYREMAMGGDWTRPWFGAVELASVQHRGSRPMMLLFLASALLVLLIALVNLTNLMLLRALSRNHDVAVRSALGAPLLRLMLPALGEGLLVGGGGALLGKALAVTGLAALQTFIPVEWLRGEPLRMGAAAWVLAFAIGLAGAVLAALLSLWRSRSGTTVDELREGGRSSMGVLTGRFGRVLVVAQVALATILLCAAGVFMHALYDASELRLGFAVDNILTFELAPVKATYPDAASVQNLALRLVERMREIPGVTDVAVTTNLPVSADTFEQFNTTDRTPEGKEFQAQYHGVGADFFQLFAIALKEGRVITREDVRGGEPVAVVSQDLADTYYGGHALGRTIALAGDDDVAWQARIVGVVGQTYQKGPLQPREMMVYAPLAQVPEAVLAIFRELEPLRFALRGHGLPADWRGELRKAVADIAPEQPVAHVRSMRSIVEQTTASARLGMLLTGIFATLALLLAVAGLYAVMAVAVAAREREFGVRAALGAHPSRLVRLVLRTGLIQVGVGLVLGVGVMLAASRSLSMLLVLLGRSSSFDPLVVAGVCAVLSATGLLACFLPAMRAGRVQPMRALRGE